MKKNSVLYVTYAAMIAAAYVVLTVFVASFNMASGAIQVRLSEALTILPAFTNAAVPGLFVGCLISNLVTGLAPMDIVFGSLATLIGAFGTHALRKKNPLLASVPPIVSNTVIVPFILKYVYNIPGSLPFFMLTIFAGEFISCGILGQLFYHAILPHKRRLFPGMELPKEEQNSETPSDNSSDNV